MTEEILQHLYDSEIHLRIGWMWDGGVDYSFGTTSNDLWDSKYNKAKIHYTGKTNIADAVREIADHAAKAYPKSTFAKWYAKTRKESMNRPIKFRAWNSAEDRMYHDVGVNPHAEWYFVFDKNGAIQDVYGSMPTLMQFTGLTDKNGKEIYEGDIVNVTIHALVTSTIKATVDFDKGCWGVKPLEDPLLVANAVGKFKSFDGCDTTILVEVIGNIYENAELLPRPQGGK
jgi:uncharacterized phage protein (TIGR01671 family)